MSCMCGCGGVPSLGHRFLVGHYARTQERRPLEERFWQKVERRTSGQCWPWTGGHDGCGYGTISRGGKRGKVERAHRISWELHHGPIPPSRQVLHRCDNPPCVNPAHLFLGDHTANMRDMAAKGRGRCDPKAARMAKAKLTEAQVLEIRAALAAGEAQVAIAARYGIEQTTVSMINRKKTWGYLGGPEGRHAFAHRGERRGNAKLTTATVVEIRASTDTCAALGRKHGVSEGLIRAVRQRRAWKHVA